MRLQQYINESYEYRSDDIDIINNYISKNCKPYLNLIKGKNPLYRGMDSQTFGVKKVRQDRKNKGYLEKELFVKFNDLLQLNGHNRRDNVVICTSNMNWASSFGMDVYMIFPIGNISYSWVESKDFNKNDTSTSWDYRYPRLLVKDQQFNSKVPVMDFFHTDTGFNTAYDKGYEFWIKCKEYFYVMDDDSIVWDEKYQEIV